MSLSRAADTRIGALLAVLLLALNVAAVSSKLGFVHKPKQVKEYDHWRYVEMARGAEGRPALQKEPPYCFRLAVPALVRGLSRLGLSVNAGFFLVTNAVLLGFLLLLWLHLGDLGFALPLRVTGLLVVGFTQGAVRWFEYQYWMTDPAALFLVMLAFFLLEREKRGAVLAASLLASFVRETYILVYPYALLRDLRTGRGLRAAVVRTATIAALPFAALVAVRRLVAPNQPDDFVSGIVDSMTFRWNHLLDNQPYVITLGAFGVLVPLVLLFPARLPRLARRHFDRALYVVSVYATLVISNNNERPLSYALPALVPAALYGLRTFLAETRLPVVPVLGLVVALQALFWSGQRWAEMGMSIYQPVNWVTVVAMAAFWLAAQVALRPRPGGRPRSRDLELAAAVAGDRHVGRGAGRVLPRALGDDQELLVRVVAAAGRRVALGGARLAVPVPGRTPPSGVERLADRHPVAVRRIRLALAPHDAEGPAKAHCPLAVAVHVDHEGPRVEGLPEAPLALVDLHPDAVERRRGGVAGERRRGGGRSRGRRDRRRGLRRRRGRAAATHGRGERGRGHQKARGTAERPGLGHRIDPRSPCGGAAETGATNQSMER